MAPTGARQMLGRLGVQTVADHTSPDGRRSLRRMVERLPTPLVRRAVAAVSEALDNEGIDGWYRFITAVFRGDVVTVQQLAAVDGVDPRHLRRTFFARGCRIPSSPSKSGSTLLYSSRVASEHGPRIARILFALARDGLPGARTRRTPFFALSRGVFSGIRPRYALTSMRWIKPPAIVYTCSTIRSESS